MTECLELVRIEPLLPERVAVHVIAVPFPEAGDVVVRELESSHPFDRLPCVQMGHDQAQGITMVWCEGLAIVVGGK